MSLRKRASKADEQGRDANPCSDFASAANQSDMKTPPAPGDADGVFMHSPLWRLPHLLSQLRSAGFVPPSSVRSKRDLPSWSAKAARFPDRNRSSDETIENRLRYFGRIIDGGDVHEESISHPGDRCHCWYNCRHRAGRGARSRSRSGIRSRCRCTDRRCDRGCLWALWLWLRIWAGLRILRLPGLLRLRSGALRLLRRRSLLSAPLLEAPPLLVSGQSKRPEHRLRAFFGGPPKIKTTGGLMSGGRFPAWRRNIPR